MPMVRKLTPAHARRWLAARNEKNEQGRGLCPVSMSCSFPAWCRKHDNSNSLCRKEFGKRLNLIGNLFGRCLCNFAYNAEELILELANRKE